jgi:hypothetical protein
MGVRFGLLSAVGTEPGITAWAAVAALSVGHITLNYLCARILVLRTLNYERFRLTFDSYFVGTTAGTTLSPQQIAEQESVLPSLSATAGCLRSGAKQAFWAAPLQLGVKCEELLPAHMGCTEDETAAMVRCLLAAHDGADYLLGGDPSRQTLCAVLREHADTSAQYEAALHAELVRRQLLLAQAPVSSAQQLVEIIVACRAAVVAERGADGFRTALQQTYWHVDQLQFNAGQWRLLESSPQSKKNR